MVWVQILILCFGEHGRDQAFHARRRIGAIESRGTLLTIFTNIFAASLNHDIIILCHDRRDWMHPERFVM
jgi:hypothetical protein